MLKDKLLAYTVSGVTGDAIYTYTAKSALHPCYFRVVKHPDSAVKEQSKCGWL